MMQHWRQYAESATALFVIADPIGAVPIFISLTPNYTKEERQLTTNITAMTVAIVLVVSIFAGQPLLRFFGISLPSFRVGGGILILLMAIAMMQARPSRTQRTPEEAEEAAAKDDIAVVPLGIPLIAGPGAISTVIIYAHQATAWLDTAFLILVSIMVAASVWVALRLADPISRMLGKTGINIVTR
jgi:multiple antibiotic resistance protein